MTRVAPSRLMKAMASLPPADRALVNLWVNRGLDDTALAGLLGMSEETIASRRARIVEHLSSSMSWTRSIARILISRSIIRLDAVGRRRHPQYSCEIDTRLFNARRVESSACVDPCGDLAGADRE